MVRWLCFSFLFIYFSSEKKRSTVGNYFVKSSKLYLHSLKSILPLSSWFYFVFKLGVGESSFPCAPLPLFIYITHSNLQHSSPFLTCLKPGFTGNTHNAKSATRQDYRHGPLLFFSFWKSWSKEKKMPGNVGKLLAGQWAPWGANPKSFAHFHLSYLRGN